MKEWKGTKEPVTVRESYYDWSKYFLKGVDESNYKESSEAEMKANAQLFTDALKVMRETGMSPSELMELVNELKGASSVNSIIENQLREENAILKRKLENIQDKHFERMDKDDAISGGRSLSEVCEENAKLKETLKEVVSSLKFIQMIEML